MSILIVSSCTSSKKYNEECLVKNGLESVLCTARDMYKGEQHVCVIKGIDYLREHIKEEIDLKIVSAGYGLINENEIIKPYDITFSNKKDYEIKEMSEERNINHDINNIINNYDLVIVLLGKNYLKACQFEKIDIKTKIVFFAPTSIKSLIPKGRNVYMVDAGEMMRNKYGCNMISLKGHMFENVCFNIIENKISIEDIVMNPLLINKLVEKEI